MRPCAALNPNQEICEEIKPVKTQRTPLHISLARVARNRAAAERQQVVSEQRCLSKKSDGFMSVMSAMINLHGSPGLLRSVK